jgi:hypothetical protein
VDAGVDHQADAAPDVAAQPAEVAVGVGVLAHLLGEPLRIEAPALDIGAVAAAGVRNFGRPVSSWAMEICM